MVDTGEIEDEVLFATENVLLHVLINFRAIIPHGYAAAEFHNYYTRLQIFLGERHMITEK